jgi:hypothetical protein
MRKRKTGQIAVEMRDSILRAWGFDLPGQSIFEFTDLRSLPRAQDKTEFTVVQIH